MNDIKIFKNNTGTVKIILKRNDGSEYNVPTGHILKFTVKKSAAYKDDKILIDKEIVADGGNVYYVALNGIDTDLEVGNYRYDIKDITQNLTFFGGDFVIKEVVLNGLPIEGVQSELVDISGEIDLGILVNRDYNLLSNKPKINSVELVGDIGSENLGISYNDLTDLPDIPEKLSDLTNDLNFVSESVIDNKDAVILNSAKSYTDNSVSGLASESYVDTGDTNTLSEAKDYTDEKISEIDIPTKLSDLTNDLNVISESAINQKDTNTLNSAKSYVDTEIGDLDIPTKTSDLTNDSGFITSADVPTKTSDLTNDSGYITSADIPTIPSKTSDLTNDSGFITSSYHDSTKLDKSDSASVVYINDSTGEPTTKQISDFAMESELLNYTPKPQASGSMYYQTFTTMNNDGSSNNQLISSYLIASHVPIRNANGNVKGNNPKGNSEYTIKSYVDTADATTLQSAKDYADGVADSKLDKIENTTNLIKVYAENPSKSGTSLIKIASNTNNAPCIPYFETSNSMPFMNAIDTKYINVRQTTPAQDSHLASKLYVDTTVASVLPAFTSADEGKVLGIVNGQLAWVEKGGGSGGDVDVTNNEILETYIETGEELDIDELNELLEDKLNGNS